MAEDLTITVLGRRRCARCGMDIAVNEAYWASPVFSHVGWHADEMRCIQLLVEHAHTQSMRIDELVRELAPH